MTPKRPRSNAVWLADLVGDETSAETLADLREYLLRAVFLYLDRHREDLADLDRRELEQLAEDFTQDALLQVLGALHTFRGESKFTTWAYRFVINVAAGELRLHRWRTLSIEALTGEHELSRSTLLLDYEAPDPEVTAARQRALDAIREIIRDELADRQRFALLNIHFQDMPVEEVARLLDSSPNAIYKLLHDARKKVKQGLQHRHYSETDLLGIFRD